LQDSGERLELKRPDVPDTNGVAFVVVDEVRYNDKAPWPYAADGSGASLQRRSPAAYGNDPVNWQAAAPSPGAEPAGGPPPAILAQPQSLAALVGQTAEFNVTAAGAAPLAYQWAFNGRTLEGATSSNLVLSGVLSSQAGNYSVTVFNQAGAAVSAVAHLTVASPLIVLSQPTNQLVRPGSNAVFRVVAAGSGALTYQWRRNGVVLPGSTSATLAIPNAQLADAGSYTCVITDQTGPVSSAPAELVILIDPIITQQPLGQSVVAGGTVTLSVSVTNTATLPIGYRWRRNGIAFTTNSLHERACFLTLTNLQFPATNFTVVVTNLARASILSASAFLTYLADTDGDGLPDAWEIERGLSPIDAADAQADSDGDGMANGQEYAAGTDPADPQSYLKIEAAASGGNAMVIFGSVSNRTYSVEFKDFLDGAPWQRLADVLARSSNGVQSITDRTFSTNRFYRVVTPRRL
jgi:hypothetical protein